MPRAVWGLPGWLSWAGVKQLLGPFKVRACECLPVTAGELPFEPGSTTVPSGDLPCTLRCMFVH
jgi:hypothetical protein